MLAIPEDGPVNRAPEVYAPGMPDEREPAGDGVEALRMHCTSIGFDLEAAGHSLVERMQLLAEHSKAFDDATRMASYAQRIFRHYDTTRPAEAFNALERQTIVLACLFSDIGKTGPVDADSEARRLVAQMFAVENVRDDTQTVASFLHTHFPDDAHERIARFRGLGLDTGMSVRQFWNLHSDWTLAIAEAAGLPPEAAVAAATHHLLDDVNPRAIVGADGHFTRDFGKNACFDRIEKLVILLDKYDAARRRGGRTHAEAIGWLGDRIASTRFRDDRELLSLLADVDVVLGEA